MSPAEKSSAGLPAAQPPWSLRELTGYVAGFTAFSACAVWPPADRGHAHPCAGQQICGPSAPSVIGRVWSIVHRAGPCFCPWSAGRHEMRTMVRRAAPISTSCFLRHGQMRARPVLRPCSGRTHPKVDLVARWVPFQGGARVAGRLCRFLILERSPVPKPVHASSPKTQFRISTSRATSSPACAPRRRSPSSCTSSWRCAVPRL